MKLEDQVCSLELAKRLKELGVKQESYFCWYGNILASEDRVKLDLKERGLNCYGSCEIYSAFTVGELGEMLPRSIIIRKIELSDANNGWLVECAHNEILAGLQIDKKLADALAKMFIHLSETHNEMQGL